MSTPLARQFHAALHANADMSASPGGASGAQPPADEPDTAAEAAAGMAADPRFERVVSGAHEAVDTAAESLALAADQLRQRASRMAELEREYMEAARGCVRDHPLSSVAAALLAGVLIGRMTR